MQTLKKKWVWIIGAVALLAVALPLLGKALFGTPTARAATQMGQVTRGDIESQVVSSAALQPAADLLLTFGSGGTLATLNVKPGDKVEVGQVIGQLDPSDLQLAITQAEANLSSAQAKLDTTKAGSTAKDIANAQDALKSAQARLDSVKAGPTAADLASAQAGLKSAQAKLASVKASSTPADIANAEATLRSAQAKLDSVKAGSTAADIANAEATLKAAQAKLADLKAGNRKQDIAAAEANLKSAQAKLAALKAGPTAAEKSAAQLKVTQAQASLEKTRSSSSLSKQQAELSLDQAHHALLNAQDKYNSVAGPLLNADGTLKDGLTSAQIDNYNTTLRALQDAEDSYRKAQLSLDDARLAEVQNMATAQAQLDDANKQLQTTLAGPTEADLAAAEASVVSSQNSLDKLKEPPTAADLASAQAAVDQAKNNLDKLKAGPTAADLASAQATVDQAKNNLDKLKEGPTDADLAAAEASVASAQSNLAKVKAPTTQSDIVQAEASVSQAKNNLDALMAGPTASDLATSQASVDQAKANLDSAKLKLKNATIVAPFSGVVADVPVTKGQTVAASTTIAELVDDRAYHVDMNVGEADITRVKVGQSVDLTFDALSGQVYTGTVTYVAPKATTQNGVVSYLATVAVDPKAVGGDLRPGLSATAAAIVERRQNVLSVPNRAVRTEGRQKVVYVIGSGGEQVRVPVQTGLSNETSTEIMGETPLREGDALVLNTTTTTTTGNAGRGNSIFGGGAPVAVPIGGR
jgi:HlyD family secretion protein